MARTIDLRETTLAILAGGRSQRMGFAKTLLQLDGRPILQYILDNLRWPGPTLLVTAPGREHPPAWELFDAEVTDSVEQGPLRGILTALQHCQTPELAVITVDMPVLRQHHLAAALDRLLEKPELLGLMFQRPDGQTEPFPLACRIAARQPVSDHVESGKLSVCSVSALPGFAIEPAPPDWPPKVWTNLNSPEDYARFVARHDQR